MCLQPPAILHSINLPALLHLWLWAAIWAAIPSKPSATALMATPRVEDWELAIFAHIHGNVELGTSALITPAEVLRPCVWWYAVCQATGERIRRVPADFRVRPSRRQVARTRSTATVRSTEERG